MIIRLPFVSLPLSPRAVIAGLVLLIVLAIASAHALMQGTYPLTLPQIRAAIAGQADAIQTMIVMDHRLPRILTAIGAGAAFGLSGAMMQSMLRNPLASPDVIGFSAGAGCGALAALLPTGGLILPGALGGGLIAAAAVLALAWKDGLHPYRLILVGIGASLTLSALADLLMSRLDVMTAADMAQWLIGTLNNRDWSDVALVWSGLLVLLPLTLWLEFPLSRMVMSDDVALSLGLPLSPLRLLITATAVALVALAVCGAGPLPFVAFVSGPIARRLAGTGRQALIHAAIIGALVVVLADVAARSVPGIHLPAGVFTAIIGAPVLMWLLMVQFKEGTL